MNKDEVNVSFPCEGAALVEFCGEHDLTTKEETAALLDRLATENELLVVDLCSATFIDSSFMSCLVSANRAAAERNHQVRLVVDGSAAVEAVLKITRLDEQLTIVTSRDEALA